MANVGLLIVVDRLRRGLREPTSDGDLLDRFVTHRDETAFAELVVRHGPKVYAVCRRVLGRDQLAEDAYQATFVVLAKKAHTVHPRSAVGGFLYGVARKAALRASAVTRRRKETLVGRVPETRLAEPSAADSDVLAMLDEEIANLSDTLRAAVVLCELDGVSRADAARQLGIAAGTLSSRLAAARKQLAERLKKRGVVLSTGLFATLGSSATAVGPPILDVATASVTTVTEGVLRTMLLAKLKTTAMAGVLLALFLGLGGFVPKGDHEAAAAPVPKVEKDEGLIWVFDPPAGVLIAHTPDGKEVKTIKLRDGAMNPFYFVGLTGDGQRAMLLAKMGEIPDTPVPQIAPDGLTVHLLPLHEPGKLTDTGIDYEPSGPKDTGTLSNCDSFATSPDGQFIYRSRDVTKVDAERATFTVTRFDRSGMNPKEIGPLPNHSELTAVYPNGDLLLNTYRPKESPIYVAYRFTPGGKSELVSGKSDVEGITASRDGTIHLATALPNAGSPRQAHAGGQLVVIDPKSGKHTRIDQRKNTADIFGFWSPDGKRIAVQWHERLEFTPKGGNEKIGRPGKGEITICNADGSGESRLMELSDPGDDSPAATQLPQRKHLLGWFPAKVKLAAPVPKAEKVEDGLIWTYHYASGELMAYTPAGEKTKTLRLKDGRRLLAITTDGKKIAFLGKDGRLADPAEQNGLSIHLRDIDEKTEGLDTGIRHERRDQFLWSPDGKKVVRIRFPIPAAPPIPPAPPFQLRVVNSLIDLETKVETPLPLAHDPEQVAAWSPDGTWLLTSHYAQEIRNGNVTNYRIEHHRHDLKSNKSQPLGESLQLHNSVFSPDGRTLFGTGIKTDELGKTWPIAMVCTDVATGKSVEVARRENQSLVTAQWSPSGKRVTYLWYDRAKKGEAFLTISDPDGKNAKLVTIPTPHDTANEVAILGWFPAS